MNLRLRHFAEWRQEIEVAAVVGLPNMLGIKRAVTARITRRRLLPGRLAARHLVVGDVQVDAARRKAAWQKPAPRYPRGYGALYSEHIGQADDGCDFDFLAPLGKVPEPEIH